MREVPKILAQLSSTLDFNELEVKMRQQISQLLDCDRVLLWHHNARERFLWTRKDNSGIIIKQSCDEGIQGHVLHSEDIINLSDAQSYPLFNSESDKRTNYITKSILCQPLTGQDGRPLGVIEVNNKRGAAEGFDGLDEVLC